MGSSHEAGTRECAYCKETLRVVAHDGRDLLVEVASGNRHVCWENLPSDANLLVLED